MPMKFSNGIKISIVAAACILALAAVSRYFLNVQLDFISQYGPVWVYIAYVITRDNAEKSKTCGSPLFWSLAIIIATMAILALYAI
ncbi:MAG: hypothetical protein V1676_06180 [Candidatus Diapherotrites archaeon]